MIFNLSDNYRFPLTAAVPLSVRGFVQETYINAETVERKLQPVVVR